MGLGALRRHHAHRGVLPAAVAVSALAEAGSSVASEEGGPPETPTQEDWDRMVDALEAADETIAALRGEIEKARQEAEVVVAKAEADAKAKVEAAETDADRRLNALRAELGAQHAADLDKAVAAERERLLNATAKIRLADATGTSVGDRQTLATIFGPIDGGALEAEAIAGARADLDAAVAKVEAGQPAKTEAPAEPAKPAPAEKPAKGGKGGHK